jgi:ABC-2 type transport system ATP-binding protein
MDRPAVLSLRRLDKSYGRVRALSEVSLDLAAGESVAVLGTQGAGKSTLVQLAAGLFAPDAGTVAVLGHDIRLDPTAARAAVGVVFEQPTLDLDQTLVGNLRYHADLYGLQRKSAGDLADDLLTRLGVAGMASDRVRSLSIANRRRVELVRAMLHQPAVILVDAVAAGLEDQPRRELFADLRRAKPDAMALLWTTDRGDEAEGAERVAVLHRGHILFDGTPGALVAEQAAAGIDAAMAKLVSQRQA